MNSTEKQDGFFKKFGHTTAKLADKLIISNIRDIINSYKIIFNVTSDLVKENKNEYKLIFFYKIISTLALDIAATAASIILSKYFSYNIASLLVDKKYFFAAMVAINTSIKTILDTITKTIKEEFIGKKFINETSNLIFKKYDILNRDESLFIEVSFQQHWETLSKKEAKKKANGNTNVTRNDSKYKRDNFTRDKSKILGHAISSKIDSSVGSVMSIFDFIRIVSALNLKANSIAANLQIAFYSIGPIALMYGAYTIAAYLASSLNANLLSTITKIKQEEKKHKTEIANLDAELSRLSTLSNPKTFEEIRKRREETIEKYNTLSSNRNKTINKILIKFNDLALEAFSFANVGFLYNKGWIKAENLFDFANVTSKNIKGTFEKVFEGNSNKRIVSAYNSLNSLNNEMLDYKKKKQEFHDKFFTKTDPDSNVYVKLTDGLEILNPVNDNLLYSLKGDILIKKGERIKVVGENGSGKSCLLKFLAGYHSKARIKEKVEISDNINIYYIPQTMSDDNYYHTIESIILKYIESYNREQYEKISEEVNGIRFMKPEFKTVLTSLICTINLENFKKNYMNECIANYKENPDKLNSVYNSFSGGEKQIIYLISAIMAKPHLLILDESLSAVDPNTAKNIYRLFMTNSLNTFKIEQYDDSTYEFIPEKGKKVVLNQDKISMLSVEHRGESEYIPGFYKNIKIENINKTPESKKPVRVMTRPASALNLAEKIKNSQNSWRKWIFGSQSSIRPKENGNVIFY